MNLESIQLRLWSVFFICLGVSINSSAQQQFESSTPPIEILKLKWEKEVRLPRSFDPSIIPGNATSTGPTAGTPTNAADATRAATKARNDAAEAETVFPVTPRRLPVFYTYSMKIRNTSDKTIQGLAWDYLFLDAIERTLLGGHQFYSYQKVTPGKVVTFQRALRSPPVAVVQVAARDRSPTRFTEKAVIECILYFDGSVWRSPMAREGVCDALKNNKAMVAR